MKKPILRPARASDQLDAHNRALLLEQVRMTRAEIEQIFMDAEHWNRMHPNEAKIDVDSDGTLRQTADDLDALLLREQSTM